MKFPRWWQTTPMQQESRGPWSWIRIADGLLFFLWSYSPQTSSKYIIYDRPPFIHEFLIDTAFYFFSKKDRPQALYDCWRVIMAQLWRLVSLAAIVLISYYLVSRMGASQSAWHSKILGMTGLCHQLSCLFLPEIDRNDANRFSSTQQLSLDLYFFLDN